MKVSEIYSGNWLKATDLHGKSTTVTIESAVIEEVGKDKEKKLVLYFVGKDKGLVVNKTNATTIAKLYSDDTEAWIGKKIRILAREVEFQGEMVWAIRVSLDKPQDDGDTTTEEDPY